jgi:hypothetical protein
VTWSCEEKVADIKEVVLHFESFLSAYAFLIGSCL